jgi:hypothetical protein
MGKMKREEEMVYEYLMNLGYEEIQHEPNCQGNNGNIPPDFSIKGNIGIEVRRLNQYHNNGISYEPLEKVEHSLSDGITNFLKSYNKDGFEKSAFIDIKFSRPIRYSKSLIKELKKELDEHLPNIHLFKEFQLRNLSVKLFPSSSKLDDVFHLGVQVDKNSGGHIVSNLYKNLELIINEKTDKVRPEFKKYNSWWLILIDDISFGVAENDLDQLNKLTPFEHCFDKILLLSPVNRTQAQEVKL